MLWIGILIGGVIGGVIVALLLAALSAGKIEDDLHDTYVRSPGNVRVLKPEHRVHEDDGA